MRLERTTHGPVDAPEPPTSSERRTLDGGFAGWSAQREFERRKAKVGPAAETAFLAGLGGSDPRIEDLTTDDYQRASEPVDRYADVDLASWTPR